MCFLLLLRLMNSFPISVFETSHLVMDMISKSEHVRTHAMKTGVVQDVPGSGRGLKIFIARSARI